MENLMKKQKLFVPLLLLLAAATLLLQACGPGQPPEPEAKVEVAIPTPTALATPTATATPTEVAEIATVEPAAEATEDEVQPAGTVEEIETPPVDESPATSEPEPALPVTLASEPFTATIGLDSFAAYRVDVSSAFTGTLKGEPTSGDIVGLLEATKNPEARHLRVEMNGETLKTLSPLGVIEIYDIGDTFYLQNPTDGTETINGVATRRYIFGPDDLTGGSANYDEVDGTIWVATEGNYVVRFEASLSGRHDNLAVSGTTLLDEGTITMRYDLSEVNGDLSIERPADAGTIDLGKLLFQ
jgi:hypothetical protein